MVKSWIVYGPQGSGKSLHAEAIAKSLGLRRINHEWDGNRETFDELDTLHLAIDFELWMRETGRVMSIEAALKRSARKGLRALKTANVGDERRAL